MHIYTKTMKEMSAELLERLGRYRHSVFIKTLGWDLDTPGDIETDQFDRPDTVFVIAEDKAQNIIGCSRLLPTTRPYLLKDIFPELLGREKAPESHRVWELSRFSALNLNRRPTSRQIVASLAANRLLKATIRIANQLGARELITVSPKGMNRLIEKNGYRVRLSGPPKVVNGDALCSCHLNIA